MSLLAAENISKKFSDQIIIDQISFTVKARDKIGLVGKNGIGKTTLFELLVGNIETDKGTITRSRSCLIDYIPQDKSALQDTTLSEYVTSARSDLLQMRRDISILEERLMKMPSDKASLDKLGHIQHKFETEGGFTFENEVATILHGVGFEKDRHHERISNFSGGEKNRAGLAHALAGRGNLLLLDEPTNHLDIESTLWLENYLAEIDKSYIIVSHDRAFLSAAVNQVWEIQFAKLHLYKGNFENYLIERKDRKRLHEHRYKHQQEEIKRLEDFVQRNMAGQKTKQAKSKLKYLNRIKRLPPPRSDGSAANINVQSSGRSYAHVLEVKDLTIGYGSDPVLSDVNFDLYRGDKVGLIGRNGSGKTTILLSLIGELSPIAGDIRLGNNVDVAYFDQELTELDPDVSAMDTIWDIDPTAEMGKIRSYLARFGFTGEDSYKLVKTLSGGEKTKLAMAKLLYYPANFLIFDEPTNHLDIDAREILEQALKEYEGSCLIVSHDRHFLECVTDKIFHVIDGQLNIYNGNYAFFKEKMSEREENVPQKPVKSKEAYLTFKEKSKRISKHKKLIQSTKSKIADLEKELVGLEEDIHHNIPRSDWEALNTASENKSKIENELLILYAKLEELEGIELD